MLLLKGYLGVLYMQGALHDALHCSQCMQAVVQLQSSNASLGCH